MEQLLDEADVAVDTWPAAELQDHHFEIQSPRR
jgi:hypothetical protein